MIRKTALLTGIAGLMLTAAPAAFAQDAGTPPAATQAAPAAPAAQPGTLQLQPGSDVKGSDGAVLGKLEGVRSNAAGEQELTVRGTDGQLRGVPLGGLKPEGAGVSVAWTSAEYTAAPAIEASATTAAPASPPASPEAAPETSAPDAATPEAAPAPAEEPMTPPAEPQAS